MVERKVSNLEVACSNHAARSKKGEKKMGESVYFKFVRGDEVKDIVTSFVGIVIAQTAWQTGCNTCGIQSQTLTQDGSRNEPEYIDENRLELVTSQKVTFPFGPTTKKDQVPKLIGGPQPTPKQY